MPDGDDRSASTDLLVSLATVGVLGLTVVTVVLTALAVLLGYGFAAAALVVLAAMVTVPLVALGGYWLWTAGRDDAAAEPDPVARLRERYARGEIDEAEFERRLERLLETEDLDARVGDREREPVGDRESVREFE